MENHGVDVPRRRDITREHVLAMRALWRDDVACFAGEFVRFGPSWSWPKPVQCPGPPVFIGGASGPKLFQAVAEYGVPPRRRRACCRCSTRTRPDSWAVPDHPESGTRDSGLGTRNESRCE
ncbi:hypothetical protein Misp02_66600 [Microtetraspora sp. NBRC 16547]|nr:hypothetical protein Misp02_66600 [Microtetraspora sp. NBRC 16547]